VSLTRQKLAGNSAAAAIGDERVAAATPQRGASSNATSVTRERVISEPDDGVGDQAGSRPQPGSRQPGARFPK
jgi:hypothetical protein